MRILVTGGNGFIASHCISTLLKQGHSVIFTVRTQAKGEQILQYHHNQTPNTLSYTIVPDIAAAHAFDATIKSTTTTPSPITGILHIASPYHFRITHRQTELLDPAINGTTGLLQAVHTHAPPNTVRRIVLTSSFAAMVTISSPPKVYTETCWNDVTPHDALTTDLFTAWRASKTFAERAAWDFVATQKPAFDIVAINPPLVFGPLLQPCAGEKHSVNTSNQRIADLIGGKMRAGLAPTGIFIWVDVRDLALAHVRALEVPEAGGKRVLCTAGFFCNADIADAIERNFELLRERLPEGYARDLDAERKPYEVDNGRSRELLGMRYRGIEESVVDTVRSLLVREQEIGKAEEEERQKEVV